MKVKITWNGMGGELDSVIVDYTDGDASLTNALIKLVRNNYVTPGDTFTVEPVAK